MHLLSNCQLESSSSSSCTMFMSRCHKTVSKLSKQSSNCSKVGLLLSSQSTSVTLTWVTAKAGYGQWLELGSIKNHFTAYWELPNTWGMIISGSWATLDFTWRMSFCYLSLLSQENLWTSCAVGIFFPFQFSDVSMWSRMWFFLSCFCLNIKVIETCVMLHFEQV